LRISVIIPAFNEEHTIGFVLDDIDKELVTEIIVVNNGSTDGTAEISANKGARVIFEPNKGYGWACLAGIKAAENPDIYVFLDGDYSDHPELISDLIKPILDQKADFVVGSRTLGRAEKGSMSLPQQYGNWLAAILLNKILKTSFTDLGPFRAIKAETLKKLSMKDKKYGWTVEMQIKAAFKGVPIIEIPVPYRKRPFGKSKVSGTVKGVVLASTYILYYIFSAWVKKITGRFK
jgi:glycosyltransferase involved in cell wall biosynthesis